jgi:hypothetical protein
VRVPILKPQLEIAGVVIDGHDRPNGVDLGSIAAKATEVGPGGGGVIRPKVEPAVQVADGARRVAHPVRVGVETVGMAA